MHIQQSIEHKLADAFSSELMRVENESHMHNVPPNSETHFKVTLVSTSFAGQGKVKRHQAVYGVLAEEMSGGVHALTLHLYTPGEWTAAGFEAPDSPNCMGGSRNDPAKQA